METVTDGICFYLYHSCHSQFEVFGFVFSQPKDDTCCPCRLTMFHLCCRLLHGTVALYVISRVSFLIWDNTTSQCQFWREQG